MLDMADIAFGDSSIVAFASHFRLVSIFFCVPIPSKYAIESWYATSATLVLFSTVVSSANESRLRTSSDAVPTDKLCAENCLVSSNCTT